MKYTQSLRLAASKISLIVSVLALLVASVPFGGTANAISFNCPWDILSSMTPTGSTNWADTNAVNVGAKFYVSGAGAVTGVKFYKGTDNTGTHVAHLYNTWTETELASATFTGESSTGWQSVNFSSPVDVNDADQLMVWVSMPNGHYAVDGGFAGGTHSFANGNIGTLDDPVRLTGGIYSYTSDDTVIPANSVTTNYWVSPIVKDDATPGANSGFTVTDSTAGPALAWTGVGYESNSVTSTANPASTTITRQASGGNEEVIAQQPGGSNIFYGSSDANGYTSKDPTALPGTSYTYRVKNLSSCGTYSTVTSATVTTASQSLENVFGNSVPQALAVTDGDPVTLGNSFTSNTDGQIWGVRFYRDYGTLVEPFRVYLWDASGNKLAQTILPAQNDEEGWIEARFSSPVSISANQTYIAGYYAPDGHYRYTPYKFENSGFSSTHITMLQSTQDHYNGLYAYGLGYHVPTNTYNSMWYGIDVNFIAGN